MTRIADLRHFRRVLLPWWYGTRATQLATLLESALQSGQMVVWEDGGRRRWSSAEDLAEMAEAAIQMIERLKSTASQ